MDSAQQQAEDRRRERAAYVVEYARKAAEARAAENCKWRELEQHKNRYIVEQIQEEENRKRVLEYMQQFHVKEELAPENRTGKEIDADAQRYADQVDPATWKSDRSKFVSMEPQLALRESGFLDSSDETQKRWVYRSKRYTEERRIKKEFEAKVTQMVEDAAKT
jgi:hypothetical protein